MLRLPIGYDIFQNIIEQQLDLIDKSLFIKDIIDDETQIVLITRPRRFGKTLNLSMLHHFLAAEAFMQPTKGLFKGLKITTVDDGKYLQHQGKYPVIFVTFKDVKDHNFENAYAGLEMLARDLYGEHTYLLNSDKLSTEDKELFTRFIRAEATKAEIVDSFKTLSKFLLAHFGVKPWLLIDEYDTPIQAAYLHGYYDEMIDFMRGLFGAALKTNPYVYKAVITGILRISKESLFSGLNNIKVYSTLQTRYSQYFGFTEPEVADILEQTGMAAKTEEVKDWYNGYKFGETIVYNPWSIVNYVHEDGRLQAYWVNTSGNDLIKNLIIKSNVDFKEQFELLLQNKPIETTLSEHVTFADLQVNEDAVWSLLVAAGYLKVTAERVFNRKNIYTLEVPNVEVNTLYVEMIEYWLSGGKSIRWYNRFLENLLQGNVAEFAESLKEVMLQIVSVHDVAKEPEAFYHGLMLGLTVSLDRNQYELKSNKESGKGRYDIVIIPHATSNNPAIILELKSVKSAANLEQESKQALEQIAERQYEAEIKQRGINKIVKIGLAFCGKEFQISNE